MQVSRKSSAAKSKPPEMLQKLSSQNSRTGSESDSPTSRSPTENIANNQSPKIIGGRLSRSPRPEGKNLHTMAELESKLSQLQEDLNKTKDQVAVSKLQKRRVQRESDEAKKHLTCLTDKLKDSEIQLQEISEAEDERINELRKIGQERDRAWQSELEALKKQQSTDSAALVAAVNELHRLRVRCEIFQNSEAAHAERTEKATSELQDLKQEMSGAVCLVEELRAQISGFEKSEAEYQELINVGHLRLEMANDTIATLQSEHLKLTETLNSVFSELQESKAQVSALEEVIRVMKAKEMVSTVDSTMDEKINLRSKLDSLHLETQQLYSALEAAEISRQEEQIMFIMQLESAYEAADLFKIDSGAREAKLQSMLQEAKAEMAEAKLDLLDKENVIQGLSDLNERLNSEKGTCQENSSRLESEFKYMELVEEVSNMKAALMDKENELKSIVEENGVLRTKVEKQEEWYHSAKEEVDIVRTAEQEALAKLEIVLQVADKNKKEVVVLAEQLETARKANLETEAELRRLTVQMHQWRKAAEVAMTILSSEDTGKAVNRTKAFDTTYVSNEKTMVNTALVDGDDECEPIKKKNVNMLRRFGVLLKKGQK